jgi:natural product precursor
MKVKAFSKKLNLNKKTIAHLDNGEMKGLRGGAKSRPTQCRMRTCEKTCTC